MSMMVEMFRCMVSLTGGADERRACSLLDTNPAKTNQEHLIEDALQEYQAKKAKPTVLNK